MASGGDLASTGASLAHLANVTASLLKLPPSLQSYVDSTLDQFSTASEYVQSATGLSPTVVYTTAGAVLLLGAIPAVASRSSTTNSKNKLAQAKNKNMSSWRWPFRGGLSPFSSSLGQGAVPAVTEDDFSYITSEDLENHGVSIPRSRGGNYREPEHYGQSAPRLGANFHNYSPPEDDIMLIKHKAVIYPEHFPAYSIGDGKLLVSDVKERVAMIMDLLPQQASKIRLYYKGRQLRDANLPIREYGVKNNSEVSVILSDINSESSGDSSEEIVVVGREADSSHAPSSKGKKKRGGRKSRRDQQRSPRESGSTLNLEVPAGDQRRREKSQVRTQSPSAGSGVSGVSGASAAAAVPGGPIDKLNGIASHFNTKLLPLCAQFTANPPSDPKKRQDEHRKLSETVMQQVLLKLDAVETNGEVEARTKRKELVHMVQTVLKGMDEKLKG